MTTTLVTGGAGFIGFHVARRLLDAGESVVTLDSLNDYYDPALKRRRLALLEPYERHRFEQVDLSDRAVYEPDADFAQPIKRLALDYSLVSPYTAFVAVDASRRTAGRHGTTVGVPVPVPHGVRYETTVSE